MADIFDKIVVGINKGVATVGANSRAMVEKAKINTAIEKLEAEKTQLINLLGQKVYDMKINVGEIAVEEISGFVNQIKQRDENILHQKSELQRIEYEVKQVTQGTSDASQGSGVACECGYTNSTTAKFCAKCGKKI